MATRTDTAPAHQLHTRMKEEGHTLASFAEATGIAYNTLKRRLKHTDNLTIAELSAIAEALDTDIMTLIAITTSEKVAA